jgi:hypothetical protein
MHPDAALMLSQHGGIPGYPGNDLFRLGHVFLLFSCPLTEVFNSLANFLLFRSQELNLLHG